MLQLKLYNKIYLLTLLVSFASFSGIANTIPLENISIELLHSKTSENDTFYNYEDGFIKKQIQTLQSFYNYNFNCLLNHEFSISNSNYFNFILKYIPLKKVKLFLKNQYFSSLTDIATVV